MRLSDGERDILAEQERDAREFEEGRRKATEPALPAGEWVAQTCQQNADISGTPQRATVEVAVAGSVHRRTIATVEDWAVYDDDGGIDDELTYREANALANLFAASKAMYEALNAIVTADDAQELTQDKIEQGRAAIRKAQGES